MAYLPMDSKLKPRSLPRFSLTSFFAAVFIAKRLVEPSKQLKQITQIENSIVKNPNWPEANQLAIYKRLQQEIF